FTEMHDAHTIVEARCLELEAELSNLRDKIQNDNHNELVKHFSNLEVNHLNLQLKYQNLKESFANNPSTPARDTPDFDSAFITRAKHLEQTNALTTENENLKAQMQTKMKSVTKDHVKPTVLAPGKYAIDVEPIPPRNRNNREVHLDYLRHLKESVETLREIVEEAKVERPLDRSIVFACRYTKHSQELLEYAIGTCPKDFNKRDKKHAPTPLISKKQVAFEEQCDTSNSNTHIHVGFGNEHFGVIIGYGDYVIGDSVISRVYYVEGLGRNLFSVGQFYDSDLEVAFRKHTCYVRDTNGVELIKGSRCLNLYTISVEDIMKSSLICLLSKASKNKSWLWHLRLKHLNFGTINDLARKDLVRGLPRLKFEKDHLCSACQLGKSKKHTHKPKPENTNLEVLNTLHMDLCGPMRVQTINGKKYILVIVDDYSRFTWVKFLRSKDETPAVVIKFLKQIQVGLNKTVRYVRTDNGTEFVNKDLTDYYERVSIFHQKTVPRTPQQNGVVERRNRTLVEAARTMLIFSKALMFLWAEAVATACYTQNRSLIHTRHDKTPYELVHDKKPDLTFFCVFGALCYPTNDSEDLGKLQPTADIRIFVGYAPSRKGYQIYNKRTRRIMETIHVQFDEMAEHMSLVQLSIGPASTFLTPGQITVSVPVNIRGIPSSIKLIKNAPSSKSFTSSFLSALQYPSLHQGVAADSTLMEDNPFAPVDNHPFINVFALEPSSEASSSGDLSSTESPYVSQTLHHLGKWSKDHPLDNIVLAIPLDRYPPENNWQPMPYAMQDEIHEFDRLQVWELVPQPDCVMIIALKWIYKVKLDEYGDVLKNKARYQDFDPTKKHIEHLNGLSGISENTLIGGLWYPKDTNVYGNNGLWLMRDHARMSRKRRNTLDEITSYRLWLYTMADLNIPADIAPAEQAPAVAPLTRTDDRFFRQGKWVPHQQEYSCARCTEDLVESLFVSIVRWPM
ncbi:retrovirus-related pol polyprotein from transposon TNT 1-94, partial [Tanacetum coccineum]